MLSNKQVAKPLHVHIRNYNLLGQWLLVRLWSLASIQEDYQPNISYTKQDIIDVKH